MTMINLYKQNKYQWIAIGSLLLCIMIESQCRVAVQEELRERIEKDYREYATIGARLIETTPSKMEIMPSCLVDVTVHPKHGNHKH